MSDKPSFEVIVPTAGKDGNKYWKTIGAAWQKEDGKISGNLFAHPIGESFMLVPPRTDEDMQGKMDHSN